MAHLDSANQQIVVIFGCDSPLGREVSLHLAEVLPWNARFVLFSSLHKWRLKNLMNNMSKRIKKRTGNEVTTRPVRGNHNFGNNNDEIENDKNFGKAAYNNEERDIRNGQVPLYGGGYEYDDERPARREPVLRTAGRYHDEEASTAPAGTASLYGGGTRPGSSSYGGTYSSRRNPTGSHAGSYSTAEAKQRDNASYHLSHEEQTTERTDDDDVSPSSPTVFPTRFAPEKPGAPGRSDPPGGPYSSRAERPGAPPRPPMRGGAQSSSSLAASMRARQSERPLRRDRPGSARVGRPGRSIDAPAETIGAVSSSAQPSHSDTFRRDGEHRFVPTGRMKKFQLVGLDHYNYGSPKSASMNRGGETELVNFNGFPPVNVIGRSSRHTASLQTSSHPHTSGAINQRVLNNRGREQSSSSMSPNFSCREKDPSFLVPIASLREEPPHSPIPRSFPPPLATEVRSPQRSPQRSGSPPRGFARSVSPASPAGSNRGVQRRTWKISKPPLQEGTHEQSPPQYGNGHGNTQHVTTDVTFEQGSFPKENASEVASYVASSEDSADAVPDEETAEENFRRSYASRLVDQQDPEPEDDIRIISPEEDETSRRSAAASNDDWQDDVVSRPFAGRSVARPFAKHRTFKNRKNASFHSGSTNKFVSFSDKTPITEEHFLPKKVTAEPSSASTAWAPATSSQDFGNDFGNISPNLQKRFAAISGLLRKQKLTAHVPLPTPQERALKFHENARDDVIFVMQSSSKSSSHSNCEKSSSEKRRSSSRKSSPETKEEEDSKMFSHVNSKQELKTSSRSTLAGRLLGRRKRKQRRINALLRGEPDVYIQGAERKGPGMSGLVHVFDSELYEWAEPEVPDEGCAQPLNALLLLESDHMKDIGSQSVNHSMNDSDPGPPRGENSRRLSGSSDCVPSLTTKKQRPENGPPLAILDGNNTHLFGRSSKSSSTPGSVDDEFSARIFCSSEESSSSRSCSGPKLRSYTPNTPSQRSSSHGSSSKLSSVTSAGVISEFSHSRHLFISKKSFASTLSPLAEEAGDGTSGVDILPPIRERFPGTISESGSSDILPRRKCEGDAAHSYDENFDQHGQPRSPPPLFSIESSKSSSSSSSPAVDKLEELLGSSCEEPINSRSFFKPRTEVMIIEGQHQSSPGLQSHNNNPNIVPPDATPPGTPRQNDNSNSGGGLKKLTRKRLGRRERTGRKSRGGTDSDAGFTSDAETVKSWRSWKSFSGRLRSRRSSRAGINEQKEDPTPTVTELERRRMMKAERSRARAARIPQRARYYETPEAQENPEYEICYPSRVESVIVNLESPHAIKKTIAEFFESKDRCDTFIRFYSFFFVFFWYCGATHSSGFIVSFLFFFGIVVRHIHQVL